MSHVGAYVALMKLRVVELLLVTTLPALFMATYAQNHTHHFPPLGVTIATLIGGTLAAGASNAFNMVIEVDSDRLMKRTDKRPLVSGAITKQQAVAFSLIITILSLLIFLIFTTVLATLLTLLAILFYVVGYTIWLKRRTSQNIVWGGVAGCMPVLIGWAAITIHSHLPHGSFSFLFSFGPRPIFWALAIKYKDDYAAAGIPMLPVVATMKSVQKQMWFHTLFMIAASFAVLVSAHFPWWSYVITVLLSLGFASQLFKISGEQAEQSALKLFQWSITYLSIYSLILVLATVLANR